MTKVFLGGGSYQSQSLIASAQRALNVYAEEIPTPEGEAVPPRAPGTPSQPPAYVYYPVPGSVGLSLETNLTAHLFPYSDVEWRIVPIGSVCSYSPPTGAPFFVESFSGSGHLDTHVGESARWFTFNGVGAAFGTVSGTELDAGALVLAGNGLYPGAGSYPGGINFYGWAYWARTSSTVMRTSHLQGSPTVVTAYNTLPDGQFPDHGLYSLPDNIQFEASFEIHNPQAPGNVELWINGQGPTRAESATYSAYFQIVSCDINGDSNLTGPYIAVSGGVYSGPPNGVGLSGAIVPSLGPSDHYTAYMQMTGVPGNWSCCYFLQRSTDGLWLQPDSSFANVRQGFHREVPPHGGGNQWIDDPTFAYRSVGFRSSASDGPGDGSAPASGVSYGFLGGISIRLGDFRPFLTTPEPTIVQVMHVKNLAIKEIV